MITEPIQFDSLGLVRRAEPIDFSQFKSSFEQKWDYDLKEYSGLSQSTTRYEAANGLKQEDQRLNLQATEQNLLDNQDSTAILQGFNLMSKYLEEARRSPETSLEDIAADKYTVDKLVNDDTYLVNTANSNIDENMFYSKGLLLHKVIGEAIEDTPESNWFAAARMGLPALVNIGILSTVKKPTIAAGAAEGLSQAIDTALLGSSIGNVQRRYNDKIYDILNNVNLTGADLETALRGITKDIKDNVNVMYQRDILTSLLRGPDPFGSGGGVFTGMSFTPWTKGAGNLIKANGRNLYKSLKDWRAKRYKGIDPEKKANFESVLKNNTDAEPTSTPEEVATKNAAKTAPESATEDEIRMVAEIDARKDSVQPIRFDAFIDESNRLNTNEAGRINIYHGRGTTNEAMTLTEAEDMLAVKQMDDAHRLRQTEVVSSASVKDFKVLQYKKNAGTGSQSLGPGPYGSSVAHGEESRNHYLEYMTSKLAEKNSIKPFEIDRMIEDLKLDYKDKGIASEELLNTVDFKEDLEEMTTDAINTYGKTLGNSVNALKNETKALEFQRSALLNKIVQESKLGGKAEEFRKAYIECDMNIKIHEALLEKGTLDEKGKLMTYEIPSPDYHRENWIDVRDSYGSIDGLNEKVLTKVSAHIIEPWNNTVQNQRGHTRFAASILARDVEAVEDVFDLIDAHKYVYATKHWREYYKGKPRDFMKNFYNGEGDSSEFINKFDQERFEYNWENAFKHDMQEMNIYGVAYPGGTSTEYRTAYNYVLFNPRLASPTKKIEKFDKGVYTQKLLDNGYAIVYDAEKNGYYVVESIATDPDNIKPFIIKQKLDNFNYSTEDLKQSW